VSGRGDDGTVSHPHIESESIVNGWREEREARTYTCWQKMRSRKETEQDRSLVAAAHVSTADGQPLRRSSRFLLSLQGHAIYVSRYKKLRVRVAK
jgi:hypothetical protein